MVQRPPKHQGVVGNKQGVGKHHHPRPGDRPQLPKGVEQQVKLQDQPDHKNIKNSNEMNEVSEYKSEVQTNMLRLICVSFQRDLIPDTFCCQPFEKMPNKITATVRMSALNHWHRVQSLIVKLTNNPLGVVSN